MTEYLGTILEKDIGELWECLFIPDASFGNACSYQMLACIDTTVSRFLPFVLKSTGP